MKVEIPKMSAVYPKGQLVQWSLRGADEPGVYTFTVERSGGPEGPWTMILLEAGDQYAVLDKFDQTSTGSMFERPNQLTLFDVAYYRVTATSPSGERASFTQETGPQSADRKMQQYLRKTQRDFRLSLRFNGTHCAILKRPLWGPRCAKCFDPKTKTIVRAECRECWGTSFQGGYWAPFYTPVRRGAPQSSTTPSPQQTSDGNQLRFWLPDFPLVVKYDVLVSFRDQKRFLIEGQSQTEIQLAAVHQLVDCVELPHDHLIYRFPIAPNQRDPLF